MAAQKAIEELSTRGLLNQGGLKAKLEGIKKEADPDTLDALEFLCLAEGGEITHYEVLDELANEVKDKKFASEVASILGEENQHLQLCIQLARENSSN
jgi:ferritin-like metal-binding protein YciE